MRPKKRETRGEEDLFRARLDQIIRMKHELVQLAGKLDWDWLYGEIAPLYSDKGRPGIETLDQPLRRCSQATNWGGDLGKRAISAAHQHSLPQHARRQQHWGRYKRYQLDAKRHRADTKGMYRDRTGCLHTSTQVLPLGGYDDPKVLPTQRYQDLSLISNNRSWWQLREQRTQDEECPCQ